MPKETQDTPNPTVQYAEHPREGYDKKGLEQREDIKASSWPELRAQLDALLDAPTEPEREGGEHEQAD